MASVTNLDNPQLCKVLGPLKKLAILTGILKERTAKPAHRFDVLREKTQSF